MIAISVVVSTCEADAKPDIEPKRGLGGRAKLDSVTSVLQTYRIAVSAKMSLFRAAVPSTSLRAGPEAAGVIVPRTKDEVQRTKQWGRRKVKWRSPVIRHSSFPLSPLLLSFVAGCFGFCPLPFDLRVRRALCLSAFTGGSIGFGCGLRGRAMVDSISVLMTAFSGLCPVRNAAARALVAVTCA